jgi:hypothetical protein
MLVYIFGTKDPKEGGITRRLRSIIVLCMGVCNVYYVCDSRRRTSGDEGLRRNEKKMK